MDTPTGGPQGTPNRALGLEGLLLCQLAVGLIQLALPLLHTELGPVHLVLGAFLSELAAGAVLGAVFPDTLSHTGPGLLGRRRPPASRPGAFGGRSLVRLRLDGIRLLVKAQAGCRAAVGIGTIRPTGALHLLGIGGKLLLFLLWLRRLVGCGLFRWGLAVTPALQLCRCRGFPHFPGGRLFPVRTATFGGVPLGLPLRPEPQGLLRLAVPRPVRGQPIHRVLPGLPATVTLPAHSAGPPGEWSEGCKSLPWGTDPQRESWCCRRTAGPRRNWRG